MLPKEHKGRVPIKKRGGSKGSLVIIGGNLDPNNSAIYSKIINLAGGINKAKVAIIPTASAIPVSTAYSYRQDFKKYGVPCHLIPIACEDDEFTMGIDESLWQHHASKKTLMQKIKVHNVIFLTGGVQTRITEILGCIGEETPVQTAIRETYEEGGVIADTSAGAAIMSEIMIGAGQSLDALLDGVTFENNLSNKEDNRVFLTKGWGFLKNTIVDQHFIKRGRLGRLISALVYTGIDIGIGIDENTAIVFDHSDRIFEVVGENGVIIVDVSHAKRRDDLPLEGIKISYLSHGDSFDMKHKRFTVSKAKNINTLEDPRIRGNTPHPAIFAPSAIQQTLTTDLIDNTANEASGFAYRMLNDTSGEGIKLTFSKTDETEGYRGITRGSKVEYAILNAELSIKPIKITIKEFRK
ncbi:MAG: cyanophycinase [Candidatus Korarchaeota archaeon]|nr:cyanophycinase [Candidatus Korarchaeota archaeon]NIU82778.1 cyanophycinase [Candidatus Thorarchaeota archaeon]NIW13911.1 cyanophycinase [Candidatus Thorarchaeota archaeon]NIW52028.1 cyanophycinase [Candidatus Korarchaeota archaeon]